MDAFGGTNDIDVLLRRIRAEFIEMPDLRITEAQAGKLWGLDQVRCHAVLGALVDSGFLTTTHDGAFIRSTSSLRARVISQRDRVEGPVQ
jgi:hypothetical protein